LLKLYIIKLASEAFVGQPESMNVQTKGGQLGKNEKINSF
jgi:hypothetical protein